ncbi:RNA-binding S4 domain-containing protein [Rothia dentocariosa]|uniref:RNA-binding S4 domain-containing protein n=1 Tax=Rothia dentocariosa TaxID=2047 RepID=UPI0028F07088|nr:RNA-binding S4 domain-containing protein [Rothia dentocariosa]
MAPSRRYTGDMEKIYIRDEMIRLGQFLKLANLVEDGAQAREVIQHGLVKVNGQIEEARGKQLHLGDTVSFNGVSVQVARED